MTGEKRTETRMRCYIALCVFPIITPRPSYTMHAGRGGVIYREYTECYQCLQAYGLIRILYEITAANTENKIENTEKIASAACVLAAILYRTKHKIRICTPKVLKLWVEITD